MKATRAERWLFGSVAIGVLILAAYSITDPHGVLRAIASGCGELIR